LFHNKIINSILYNIFLKGNKHIFTVEVNGDKG
jgi:hypothetical protein